MAETVGSIMGKHIGKGRFLQEENFNKELVLDESFTILLLILLFLLMTIV